MELNQIYHRNSIFYDCNRPRKSVFAMLANFMLQILATTKCFGDLGCFSAEGHFRSSLRPISVVPQSPEVVNVTFLLYTRRFPYEPKLIKVNKFRHLVDFSSKRQSKVIVHGFQEDGFTKIWIKDVVRDLLKKDDFNVFVVDWGNGAHVAYHQAAANARLVGAILARLVFLLNASHNVTIESFHLIGHSLGAHIAGYAGHILGKLGRITGLDPAKPYFEGTHPSVRLDPTDAIFVDVIHTDSGPFIHGGLGIVSPCGHVDFYPNGGEKQPGCGFSVIDSFYKEGDFLSGLRMWFTCQHKRGHQYFAESILSPCRFISIRCSDYEKFKNGECFDCGKTRENCASMGFYADETFHVKSTNESSNFYLLTSPSTPYCQIQHRVKIISNNISTRSDSIIIKFSNDNRSTDVVKLKLDLENDFSRVIGTNFPGNLTNFQLTKQRDQNPLSYFNGQHRQKCLTNIEVRTLGINIEIHSCNIATNSCNTRIDEQDVKCNGNRVDFDLASNSLSKVD